MELETILWNGSSYQQFQQYLESLQDTKYQTFQQKLIPNIPILGVRVPVLRKIAKQISKGDYVRLLFLLKHQTIEETLIHGFLIGYQKTDFKTVLSFLDDFLPFNDNWATTDLVVSSLKQFKDHKAEGWDQIGLYLTSSSSFTIRFGVVLMLSYYLDEEYIDQVLKRLLDISSDDYYVKMAVSWLLSMAYLSFPHKVEDLLDHSALNPWTKKKTIQKIIESNQVLDKEYWKKKKCEK